MNITQLGVVGAGVMGRGLAQTAAQAGINVVLIDVDAGALDSARSEIFNTIRLASMMQRGTSNQEPVEAVLQRIKTTSDLTALSEVDFLVENISEKIALKESLYPQLDDVCNSDCVFAANTSAISITRIGGWTQRPEKILGMHFMNPVPMKPMVEVIRAFHTSEATIDRAKAFLADINKEGVVVNDMPGFVSNRVLMLTVNEAIFLLQDQVATAADIDKIFKGCFGHKMGPLETGDLIGLDTILYSLDVLYDAYNDSKFRPAPLLKKMVDAGLHGRKTGEGFFKYPTLHR